MFSCNCFSCWGEIHITYTEPFKNTFLLHLVYSVSCSQQLPLLSRLFHSTPHKNTPHQSNNRLTVLPTRPPPQPLVTMHLFSASKNLPIVGTSHKMNHTILWPFFVSVFETAITQMGFEPSQNSGWGEMVLPHGIWDMTSQTGIKPAPLCWSMESYPLNHQRNPWVFCLFVLFYLPYHDWWDLFPS